MRGAVLVVLVTLALGAAPTSSADPPSYVVIVHPKNPVDEVDRAFLRRVYLKKATSWEAGGTIRPVDLPRNAKARDRFTREVIKKTPAQLRRYWSQQVFSGKGTPPKQVDSADEVIDYVLEHRGAVGYLPGDVDPGGAKVVELD